MRLGFFVSDLFTSSIIEEEHVLQFGPRQSVITREEYQIVKSDWVSIWLTNFNPPSQLKIFHFSHSVAHSHWSFVRSFAYPDCVKLIPNYFLSWLYGFVCKIRDTGYRFLMHFHISDWCERVHESRTYHQYFELHSATVRRPLQSIILLTSPSIPPSFRLSFHSSEV